MLVKFACFSLHLCLCFTLLVVHYFNVDLFCAFMQISQSLILRLIPTDAQQYHHHNPSCPCPMQSCQSKNVHTGTGPIKSASKGSVSASNGITENHSKASISTSSSSSIGTMPKVSCKVENIHASSVVIKPENDKLANMQQKNHNNGTKPHDSLYDYSLPLSSAMAYSMNLKALDSPELTPSPARGSTGLKIPSVQHEAVQPSDNKNSNKNSSDNNHQRKQMRAVPSDKHHHQITPLSIFQTSFAGMH